MASVFPSTKKALKQAALAFVPDPAVFRADTSNDRNVKLMSIGKPLTSPTVRFEDLFFASMKAADAERIVSGPTVILDARMNQILANPDSMTLQEAEAILNSLGY